MFINFLCQTERLQTTEPAPYEGRAWSPDGGVPVTRMWTSNVQGPYASLAKQSPHHPYSQKRAKNPPSRSLTQSEDIRLTPFVTRKQKTATFCHVSDDRMSLSHAFIRM